MSRHPVLQLSGATLAEIAARGVDVPEYDRSALRPRIVHVGVGGFHRAHLALYTDRAAAAGGDWGIVGLGLLDQDRAMAEALGAQDHLYTLVERGNDEPHVRVIGSIIGFVHAPPGRDDLVADLVAAPDTAVLSMTVTESGYAEPSAEQVAAGTSTFDRLAAAIGERRRRGLGPLTVLSCDNLPGNGAIARRAVLAAAERVGGPDLADWVAESCSFPNSMVDRITPVTADSDRDWLREERGIDDRWPVVGEPFRQWVLEDRFVAGRPAWEGDGALFTDDVHSWELYKLRLLNAAHSTMAYLCALADLTYVDEAFADPVVKDFLQHFLYEEALPTLTEIPGHTREEYIETVFGRLANTGVRDQIARLCIDGSAKFPTFLIPTVQAQLRMDGPITRSAAALAGWARYLGAYPRDRQAHDTSGEAARSYGEAALADPAAFLGFADVFPADLRESQRFTEAFVAAYRTVVDSGPLAALRGGTADLETQGGS